MPLLLKPLFQEFVSLLFFFNSEILIMYYLRFPFFFLSSPIKNFILLSLNWILWDFLKAFLLILNFVSVMFICYCFWYLFSMLNFYLYLICFSLSFLSSLFITKSQLWSLQTWNFQGWFLLTCLSAYIIYSLFKLMNNLFPNSSYVGRKFFLVLFFHLALDYITVSIVSFQIITHISWFRLRKRTGIGTISC